MANACGKSDAFTGVNKPEPIGGFPLEEGGGGDGGEGEKEGEGEGDGDGGVEAAEPVPKVVGVPVLADDLVSCAGLDEETAEMDVEGNNGLEDAMTGVIDCDVAVFNGDDGTCVAENGPSGDTDMVD